VPLGKMSGRGLGHTGGTLDKLESIPGYRTELTLDEFVAQVRDVGCAIIGQTGDLVPADKLLYGLRDVTATVDQLSLIAASIMSKKLAAGAQAIVLDVKVGNGAFMRTIDDARRLAEAMISLGRQAGREVVCVLTDMDQPLGAAVGNSLEVLEALETVRGHGPADFQELVLDACGKLLALSDLEIEEAEGRRRAEQAMADGSAEATWNRWIEAQGGTADEAALPFAPIVRSVAAPKAGHVHDLSAIRIGNAAVHLGAGRRTKEDAIDHAVGIVCHAKRGAEVAVGDMLAEIHARTEEQVDEAAREVLAAYELSDDAPHERHVLLEVVD
jgi:pyrimidine-nucleoside phosphorylase